MKAIVNTAPGKLEWQELALPTPGPGQVRIRTLACGICATDLVMIAGWERTAFPSIPGHEWAGMVDATGAETNPALANKRCVAENVLVDGGEVGFEYPGGFGQYLITDARNVQIIPAAITPVTAALIEPLAVSLRAFRKLKEVSNNGTLIFGDGPIGLIMVMLLKRAGTKNIFLVGGREKRLSLARELGAAKVLNYHSVGPNLLQAIQKLCGDSLGTIIEASGAGPAMDMCLDLVAPNGTILLIGDYGGVRALFPWNHLLHREITLIGSNASAGAWPEAVKIAGEKDFPLQKLVTSVFPAENFMAAMEVVKKSREAIKVVLDWES